MGFLLTFSIVAAAVLLHHTPSIIGGEDLKECPPQTPTNCTNFCVDANGAFPCNVCKLTPDGRQICRCPENFFGDGLLTGSRCSTIEPGPEPQGVSLTVYIVLGVILVAMIALCIFGCIKFIHGWILRKIYPENDSGEGEEEEEYIGLHIYTLEEMETLTDSFTNLVGKGCGGYLYNAHFSDLPLSIQEQTKPTSKMGRNLAVGCLGRGKTIDHNNVVKVLGKCSGSSTDHYLVYSFVSIGSLQRYLDGELYNYIRPVSIRISIACDIARGLNYLHELPTGPVVMRNLSLDSILLTQDYRAKIGNFATAKVLRGGGPVLNNDNIDWRHEIAAPEVVEGKRKVDWVKADVFGYGLIVAELICSREAKAAQLRNGKLLHEALVSTQSSEELESFLEDDLCELERPHMRNLLRSTKLCLMKDPGSTPILSHLIKDMYIMGGVAQ